MNKLKIGVLGAGHLGKIHLKCIKELDQMELLGFYDTDKKRSKEISDELGVKYFSSRNELIDACEAIDIVTPTIAHFESASFAMKKFKHVFIEKPIVTTVAEAKSLLNISREANVKIQVGHVERFNPAFLAARPFIQKPVFIEAHRLAQFNPRGTDVPVVLDLMIHDIDIILSVVDANVRRVSASGVPVVSNTPDIANARIEFDNGTVANLTASRISMKNMRKSRFFQRDAYISVDFLEKKTEIIRMEEVENEKDLPPFAMLIDSGDGQNKKQIHIENPEIKPINAIKMELEQFYDSIINNEPTPVGILDGYSALDIAYRVMNQINENLYHMS